MKSVLLVALAVAVLCDVSSAFVSRHRVGDRNPIVSTPYGQVQGIVELDTISAFRAIPFAQPPVGNLRFAPTVPLQSGWSGVLDGTKPSAGCMATCDLKVFPRPSFMCADTISEDCLYLNVYTPTLNTSAKLPVLVWFHGGNFMFGSGGQSMYDGSDLAKTQNIVVVTTNYRLGIFGGLYSRSAGIEGSSQLKDQRQALRFVNEIIESFGGDKNRITISGQSAGATSVATHLVSPQSWPYFQQAIMMSNPATMPAVSLSYADQLGNLTLALFGCDSVAPAAQLTCLRALPADAILKGTSFLVIDLKNPLAMDLRWGPVIDGIDVPAAPFDVLVGSAPGQVAQVPIFMGTTQGEAVQFVYYAFASPTSMATANTLLDVFFGAGPAAAIISLYNTDPSQDVDTRPLMGEILTDYLWYCSNHRIAAGLTGAINSTSYAPMPGVYFYHYDHQGSWTTWLYNSTMPFCAVNVCHAEDVPAVFNSFGLPFAPVDLPKPTPTEVIMIGQLQQLWGNFIYTGNPGTFAASQPFPHFNASLTDVVNISVPFTLLDEYHKAQCDYWDTLGYRE